MYFVYGVMCLIFGTTFLAIKIGIDAGAPPFLFAGTRFLCAGIIVLAAAAALNSPIRIPAGLRRDVLLVGACMTAILFGALYWGERYVSSSVAALLSATTPLMIAAAEWRQGVKEYARLKLSGLLLSFVGVSVAVVPALGVEASAEAILAVLVILLAEGGTVYGTFVSQKILAQGVNPFVLNGWQMVFGGFLLILLSLACEPDSLVLSFQISASWAYLVVFGSLIGHGAYYWLVHQAGPLLPSTWTYISPVIAQFVGYYVLAEYVSVYSAIGVVLVLTGVFIVSRAAAIQEWLKQQFPASVKVS